MKNKKLALLLISFLVTNNIYHLNAMGDQNKEEEEISSVFSFTQTRYKKEKKPNPKKDKKYDQEEEDAIPTPQINSLEEITCLKTFRLLNIDSTQTKSDMVLQSADSYKALITLFYYLKYKDDNGIESSLFCLESLIHIISELRTKKFITSLLNTAAKEPDERQAAAIKTAILLSRIDAEKYLPHQFFQLFKLIYNQFMNNKKALQYVTPAPLKGCFLFTNLRGIDFTYQEILYELQHNIEYPLINITQGPETKRRKLNPVEELL